MLRALPGDRWVAQHRLLVTTIGGARIVNIYAPNGGELGSPRYAYKLDWYRRLRDFLARDFDPGEDAATSTSRPRIGTSGPRASGAARSWPPRASAPASARCSPGGSTTPSASSRPEAAGVYTWWDYREGAFHRNRGLRIDHILLSQSLTKRCAAVDVDRDERKGARPSDHVPVVATLE